MNYGQRFVTLYRRQGSRPSPRKRNAKRQKALQIAEKRREAKGKGKKERYIYPFEFRVSKNSKERKESLPQ